MAITRIVGNLIDYNLSGRSTFVRIESAKRMLQPDVQIPLNQKPRHVIRYMSEWCATGQCHKCSGCYHTCRHSRKKSKS